MIDELVIKLFALLSLFFIVLLGIIVIKKGKQLINKLFAFLTIILIIWVFGSFMMLDSQMETDIEFWDRFVYAGVVFWVAIQYHFSLAVTHYNFRRNIFLYIGYILSFFFLIISRTDFFVKDVFYYFSGAHMKAQLGHDLFIIFFITYVVLFFYVLLKKYRLEKDKAERKKIFFYILGFSVLNFIGGTAFLPAYSIPIYPIFLVTPLLFSLIISYSIVYLGLMDIKLILRRYAVFFLSLISLLIPGYILVLFTYFFYANYLLPVSLIIYISSLILFTPIRKKYYSLANKYFFSSLYDSNELIFNLNKRLRSSLEIKKIFSSVTTVLTPAFHSKSIAIINFNKHHRATVLFNNNFEGLELKLKKVDDKEIYESFKSNKPISLKNIKSNDDISKKVKKFLIAMNVELVVPVVVSDNKLSNLMFFGQKQSGDSYNNKDIKILELVASEIGVAIENALLYQSVKKFNIKLKKEINKATSQLKLQNQKLIKLDKVKDEFVGIVSHQLKTPLTGIRWFTEILINNKDKNLKPKQVELLQHISASNLSLIKLVNDLLDVSHIETGRKFDIVKTEFNLNDLINEVLKENVYLIHQKKLKIENKIKDNVTVCADRDKLKQVWQNLIANATKYSKDNKVVKIYSKVNKDKETVFYVQDNGIGIPKEQQSSLFTKFFRAKNANLKHTEGTGLGLYIAREIIRAHHGEMSFVSQENKGSTFNFYLPKIS